MIPAAATPEEEGGAVPSRLNLSPAYPNPFNPATHLRYDLPTAARVNLAVYDIRGRLVAQLADILNCGPNRGSGSLPAV